jgi:hypothetical protein
MTYSWHSRCYLRLVLLVSVGFLLTSCGTSPQENEPVDSNIEASHTPIVTAEQTLVAAATLMPTPIVMSTETPGIPVATATPRPSATATLVSTPTHTSAPTATPTIPSIPCDSAGTLPDKAFPAEVDVRRSRVAVADPYLYLAVEQYIGVFDISDPTTPKFWGFWDFPALPEISDFKVHNDIAYVASGSLLEILNLVPQCRFASVARMDLPFQIFRLQVEGDRLYVGGYSAEGGPLHVNILSIVLPSQPETLSTVELERAVWSVHNEKLYSHVLGDVEKILVTDLAEPTSPRTKPVNINVEPEILTRSLPRFVKDTLYLLSERDGLFIVSDLQEDIPMVQHNPESYIFIEVFEIQDNYIFLGENSCDVECSSRAWILDAEDGTKLSILGLYPHYPVWHYLEIQEDVIYALAEDTLLVIDISDIANPMIIGEVPLLI